MRKLWLLLLGLPIPALAQVGSVQGLCDQGATAAAVSGLLSTNTLDGVVTGCTITVYYTGTSTPVPTGSIYKDAALDPLGNPFTASQSGAGLPGQYLFFASTAQAYDVVGSGGTAPNVYPRPLTLLVDVFPAGASSGGGVGPGTTPNFALFTGTTTVGNSPYVTGSTPTALVPCADPNSALYAITYNIGMCVDVPESTNDASSATSNKGAAQIAYQSLAGGNYNTTSVPTGFQSLRAGLLQSYTGSTVARNFGIAQTMNGFAGGELDGVSCETNAYGGYIAFGEEPATCFRAEQNQAPLTDGQGGVWAVASNTNPGTGTVTFPTPTSNAETLGESRFIRDLSNPYSTGTYTLGSCTAGVCTLNGVGTTWGSISGFVGTHTTYNNFAAGGNLLTTNLCFAINQNGSSIGASTYPDTVFPIITGISNTQLTVGLQGVGVVPGWTYAASGNYAITGCAYPTSVSVAANSFTAGDVSGIGAGHPLDQVVAYNGDWWGTQIIQNRSIGRSGYGGGALIEDTSPANGPNFGYGIQVEGGYNLGLAFVPAGTRKGSVPIYFGWRPSGGQASIQDASPANTTSYDFFQSRFSDGSIRSLITVIPNTGNYDGINLSNGTMYVPLDNFGTSTGYGVSIGATPTLNELFSVGSLPGLAVRATDVSGTSQEVGIGTAPQANQRFIVAPQASDNYGLAIREAAAMSSGASPFAMVGAYLGGTTYLKWIDNGSGQLSEQVQNGATTTWYSDGGVTSKASINGATGAASFGALTVTSCTGCGGAGGVTSINSTAGAFTFTGAGVSCTTTTCTFSGSGTGIGSITWALPSWLTASPTTISASGTQTFSATTGETANQFLATPNGSTGAVGLRSIVAADLPSLSGTYLPIAGGTMTGALTLATGSSSLVPLIFSCGPPESVLVPNSVFCDSTATGALTYVTNSGVANRIVNTFGTLTQHCPVVGNSSVVDVSTVCQSYDAATQSGASIDGNIQNATTQATSGGITSGTIDARAYTATQSITSNMFSNIGTGSTDQPTTFLMPPVAIKTTVQQTIGASSSQNDVVVKGQGNGGISILEDNSGYAAPINIVAQNGGLGYTASATGSCSLSSGSDTIACTTDSSGRITFALSGAGTYSTIPTVTISGLGTPTIPATIQLGGPVMALGDPTSTTTLLDHTRPEDWRFSSNANMPGTLWALFQGNEGTGCRDCVFFGNDDSAQTSDLITDQNGANHYYFNVSADCGGAGNNLFNLNQTGSLSFEGVLTERTTWNDSNCTNKNGNAGLYYSSSHFLSWAEFIQSHAESVLYGAWVGNNDSITGMGLDNTSNVTSSNLWVAPALGTGYASGIATVFGMNNGGSGHLVQDATYSGGLTAGTAYISAQNGGSGYTASTTGTCSFSSAGTIIEGSGDTIACVTNASGVITFTLSGYAVYTVLPSGLTISGLGSGSSASVTLALARVMSLTEFAYGAHASLAGYTDQTFGMAGMNFPPISFSGAHTFTNREFLEPFSATATGTLAAIPGQTYFAINTSSSGTVTLQCPNHASGGLINGAATLPLGSYQGAFAYFDGTGCWAGVMGGSGDVITTPNGTLSVSGTATATTLDVLKVPTTNSTTNASFYLPFVASSSTSTAQVLDVSANLSVNPSTGALSASGAITSGGVSNTVTGGTGGIDAFVEGTDPTTVTGSGALDICVGDSTLHSLVCYPDSTSSGLGTKYNLPMLPTTFAANDLVEMGATANSYALADTNIATANVVTQTTNGATTEIAGYAGSNKILTPITVGSGLSLSGTTLTATGGSNSLTGSGLTANDAYYMGSSGLALAEANASTTVPAICIASSTTACVFSGVVTGFSGLTQGGVVYVSDATAGALTQTAPSTSGHYIQRVGVATSTTAILVMPSVDVGTIQ
jgi:hypothetical protein